MRTLKFKMEREGLISEGEEVTVTEGKLPSNYYYTIDPSLAMSYNIPLNQRLKSTKGVVTSVTSEPRGFYVTVDFDEDEY